MEITVSSWKIVTKEDKSKTIGGTYQVKAGNMVVSETQFNDGYNATNINIPAELMVEAEKLDEKIRTAIVKNFTA